MKNPLFFIGILCILASCKKNSVEPVIANSTNDQAVNLLPSFVYITRADDQDQTIYRFSYYQNGLLKRIIKYDSIYHPDQKDSTLYTYNANNKVVETSEYSDGNLTYKTEISYNNVGNITTVSQHNEVYPQYSIKYQYIYASATDVDYVLKYDATNTVTDSIVIDDTVILPYFKPLPENTNYYTLVNGYASSNPLHCFITPTGAYYDGGIRSPGSPNANEWGYIYNDPSIQPAFINKNINFQYEVAEKFLNMGLSGFPLRNYYITSGPRQYYTGNSFAPSSGYGTTYKFDQDDRLFQTVRRFDYYTRSGSPIPGYEIIEIRYE